MEGDSGSPRIDASILEGTGESAKFTAVALPNEAATGRKIIDYPRRREKVCQWYLPEETK
jgi:hypothetical protein